MNGGRRLNGMGAVVSAQSPKLHSASCTRHQFVTRALFGQKSSDCRTGGEGPKLCHPLFGESHSRRAVCGIRHPSYRGGVVDVAALASKHSVKSVSPRKRARPTPRFGALGCRRPWLGRRRGAEVDGSVFPNSSFAIGFYISLYVCLSLSLSAIYIYIYISLSIYICVYMCIYIYIYMYIGML